ncbi:hypothetical protein LXL04_011834 [Taraxacum kok-saghyz]
MDVVNKHRDGYGFRTIDRALEVLDAIRRVTIIKMMMDYLGLSGKVSVINLGVQAQKLGKLDSVHLHTLFNRKGEIFQNLLEQIEPVLEFFGQRIIKSYGGDLNPFVHQTHLYGYAD